MRARATRLVTTGLYARFRHPIYTFGILANVGALVALQLRWLLIAWVALVPAVELFRVRNEEAVLRETFGAEYVRWRARTWF